MELIRNHIEIREIAAICIAAFLAGSICLFGETFPAAAAFMTVMLSVSTIHIYLLPLVAGGIALHMGQGVFIYGDLLATVCLSLFFLFFHRRNFSLNQRTAVGAAFLVFFNLLAYYRADMLFLLRPDLLAKELLTFCIYLRAFHVVGAILCKGKGLQCFSREEISLSLALLTVSFIGTVHVYEVAFSLWLFLILSVLCQKGLQQAYTITVLTAIYSLCLGETSWVLYGCLFAGLTAAWYAAEWIDVKYRKTVMGTVVFFALSGVESTYLYGFAAVIAAFFAVPQNFFKKAGCRIEERFMPEALSEKDLQHLAIARDLQKKRDAFVSLSRLYGRELEGKQILSYQFAGMARTIDQLQADLQGRRNLTAAGGRLAKVSVGQASYSFDEVSGDTMAAFAFDEHHLALVISDGMGKGKQASAESKMVVSTLTRLLQAGFDVDLAMKTVNGILMTGSDGERFATVDLAIIDRAKGRAKIYKMGAATTFIKHNGRVSMLKRQALPAGITSGLDLEYIDIKLRKGDLLVMVSDGVIDCDRQDFNCDWLRSRLLEIGSRDPETVAELIVNKAAEKYGIHERDDLTVMTAAIGV